MILGNVLISAATVVFFLQFPTFNRRFTSAIPTHAHGRLGMNDVLFKDILHYSVVQPAANAWLDSTYTGVPSHSSDAAWARLQEVRGVSISQSQASSLSLPKTGLSAGNATVATILGVQHNLHCIRMVRQILYPSYYYPDHDTEAERRARLGHAGHCLEALRQSVMCNPDLTPRGVRWEDEDRANIAVNPSAKMQCLDWDSLLRNIREKSYNLDDLWEANPS